MHPARAVVEALIDEELAPGGGSVSVEAFFTGHLKFGAEEERGVGIDEQQGVVREGVGGRDGDAVGSGGFNGVAVIGDTARSVMDRSFAVERLKLVQTDDAFDVAADAAFGEREGHPGFKVFDDFWFHFGVLKEVVVEAIGEGIHEGLEGGGTGCVLLLQDCGIDEEFHAQILPDFGFAFGFGETAHGIDVVGFDAIEVVFGLGVDGSEDCVRVGFSVDVGDAPVVADDGDFLGVLVPAYGLLGGRGEERDRGCEG